MSSDNLSRLLIGLKTVGVEKGERNKTVAEKTGYAVGTVNRILSGNAALTDRFIQAVCSSFAIRKEWVCSGEEPIKMVVDIAGLEGLSMPPDWQFKKDMQKLPGSKFWVCLCGGNSFYIDPVLGIAKCSTCGREHTLVITLTKNEDGKKAA